MAPSAARRSQATPTPSHHVAVPKAFTDKLLQQQGRISGLEGIVYDIRDQFRDYRADVETQMDKLDNENRQLWDRVNNLEEQQERTRETVQRLVDFIENSDIERMDKPIESKPKPQKTKATRDNVFNVRQSCFAWPLILT
jgi:C4-type Zn-finger protein